MRTPWITIAALSFFGCAHEPIEPPAPCPTQSRQASVFSDVSWQDLKTKSSEFLEQAWGTDAPGLPKRIQAYPAAVVQGRWAVDWEGSVFQECTHGRTLPVLGNQNELYEHIDVGEGVYDWDGCLDVTLRASVVLTPEFVPSGPWLEVQEVLSVESVPGRTSVGDPCLDWSR